VSIDSKEKRQSALATAGMPWEWGDMVFIQGVVDPGSRQTVVNVYSGMLADEEEETGCTKYNEKKYGKFLYCRPLGLRSHRVTFQEFDVNYVTDWNLQSPDGTIWTPTLTTGTNETPTFTWVSSVGTKSTDTPVVVQTDTFQYWSMSIDNVGVVTYTSATADGESYGAALHDDNGKVWYFFVDRNTQFSLADDTPFTSIPYMRKIGLELTYTPTSLAKASSGNEFILGRVGTDVGTRIPGWWRWWVPEVDFVQHTRTALEIEVNATEDVNVREVVGRVQTKRFKRRR